MKEQKKMNKESMKEALKTIESIEPPKFNIIVVSRAFRPALMERATPAHYRGMIPPFGSIAVEFSDRVPVNEIRCYKDNDLVKTMKIGENDE